ncbi:hypothetical protein RhiirA5_499495 [Rhizophagus irregularis]|uniref:G-protein coupled receptors family 1 profile domain-containing protein n=3 Tax=Rhizophagus irregularis TaxID=588596 RepID=A0A2I1DTR4_9GLOM|nr:hypothetical protein GLOIN_2v1510282 [Rhizophagus irregularis DAOM 181602=DAOM 197198]EXX54737.1 hypothetical protein RirG_231760 [Rhizophagus irregularis DAOM 197198w]PKC09092.1 hypothetical protein RhiirA5_499495 [Rhizophagus irregularis]PKC75075.1 hypothetical protein RhiirA1_529069 [Rhizophagus irregularis]PKY13255.1 hypothetical protein RhiirB3_518650 [Rhizophagus irregularis]POG81038.1 hypothetical protein GLOIN_2v1510282 [Rhizophagus irregularis DAOM 181602=DAOM 197198]|eukprot:XP_025187904.1 hypothetical protein GLOIN_2v1510282 [Rhizophagus irregularis DAOM 181602=DAOM 197198]
MTTYSTVAILYILLQILSLVLLSCLMCTILKSKPYFTKWTLFQICITAFGSGLTNLPVVVIYGDDLVKRAYDNPLCMILQKFSLFFIYPFEFFSCALSFYLWYALVKKDLDIEKKCFRYVSIISWVYTTVYNGILLKFAIKETNWGVYASSLNCRTSKLAESFYGYIITSSISAFLAILMSCHSAFILYRRWSHFATIKNRRTAIRLGEAVRSCAWCFVFVISLAIPLVPRAIQRENDPSKNNTIAVISGFGSASVGTFLFLIFGTNNKAAYFLPCYYAPPDNLRFTMPDEELPRMPDACLKSNVDDEYRFSDKGSYNTLYEDYDINIGSSNNICHM